MSDKEKLKGTDKQVRLKAAELIVSGKTIQQAELPAELATAVRKPVADFFEMEIHVFSPEQQAELLSVLEARFGKKSDHYKRPEGVNFTEVKAALEANPALMYSLAQMEETGGEPDIIAVEDDAFIFGDCSSESPDCRRDLTYDQAAEMVKEFGVDMMSEQECRKMQETGKFDLNTWLATPANIRETGFALFGYSDDYSIIVSQDCARSHREFRHWRGVLRVPKAESEKVRKFSPEQQAELLSVLEARFGKKSDHYKRPEGVNFTEVKAALEANPALMYSLAQMEETGGEPDIIAVEDDAFIFGDCSSESPDCRRDLTYDQAAEMVKEFGVDMMSEEVYREMQKSGKFDEKIWIWLKTPDDNMKEASSVLHGCFDADLVAPPPPLSSAREDGGELDGNRDNSDVHVYYIDRDFDRHRGWRGVLRVPKA